MRHIKSVGLCIVVACALSALAAATASASLPAFYQCVKAKKVDKKYVGHYLHKICSEPASQKEIEEGKVNKYELEEWNEAGKDGKVKEFKGKSGTGFWEVVGLGPIICHKGSYTGEVTGPKAVGKINVTFVGCEVNKAECRNTATDGEIKTNMLKGEIGYFDEKDRTPVTKGVGIALTPETGSYEAEGIQDCFYLGRLSGSLIGEIVPPYNVFTKEVKLKFEETAGRQAIQSFEGLEKDTLLAENWDGFEWLPGGEFGVSSEATGKGEELELKA